MQRRKTARLDYACAWRLERTLYGGVRERWPMSAFGQLDLRQAASAPGSVLVIPSVKAKFAATASTTTAMQNRRLPHLQRHCRSERRSQALRSVRQSVSLRPELRLRQLYLHRRSREDCGGACTNTKTEADNCGSCGNACGADRVCTDGMCVCPNSAEPNYCEGVGCVDTATDVNHCGTCGNGCTLAQVCQGGACVCPAGSPQDFCPDVGCVNRQTDEALRHLRQRVSVGQSVYPGSLCVSAGKDRLRRDLYRHTERRQKLRSMRQILPCGPGLSHGRLRLYELRFDGLR